MSSLSNTLAVSLVALCAGTSALCAADAPKFYQLQSVLTWVDQAHLGTILTMTKLTTVFISVAVPMA